MASLIAKQPFGQPKERVVMTIDELRRAFPNTSWNDGNTEATCRHGDRFIRMSIGGQVPEGSNNPGLVYGNDEMLIKGLMMELAMRLPLNVVCVRKLPTIITTEKLVLNDFDFDYPQLQPMEFARITMRAALHP